MENYFKIGKLVATYGLKGQIILQHSLGKKTSLKAWKTFLSKKKKIAFIPYFIESAKIKNETETYVKFEGIAGKEAARNLLKKKFGCMKMILKNLLLMLRRFPY